MLWFGLVILVVGVAMVGIGRSRMNVRNSKGNFGQNVRGDVTMTYNEASGSAPAAEPPSSEERFLNWGGFAVAFAGLVVSIIALWKP